MRRRARGGRAQPQARSRRAATSPFGRSEPSWPSARAPSALGQDEDRLAHRREVGDLTVNHSSATLHPMDKTDIKEAALVRFDAQGYEATTLRQLADDLGVTPAAFYYHYQTKNELLSELLQDILSADLAMFRRIRRESDDPLDLMLFVYIPNTETQQRQERVVHNETRSLQSPDRERIRDLIHEYENEFSEVIAAKYGLSGVDLEFATKAVLGMGSSVAGWFRIDGSVRVDALAQMYVRYMRGVLEAAAESPLVDSDGSVSERLNLVERHSD